MMNRLEAEIPESHPCLSVLTKIVVIFLLFFFIPINIDPPVSSLSKNDSAIIFNMYIEKFNKTYVNNETLKSEKYKAFKETLEEIEQLNSLREYNSSAKFGITKFSDLSKNEFKDTYLQEDVNRRNNTMFYIKKLNARHKYRNKRQANDLPLKIDWRTKNVLTKIKNQKDCGACWAFSTVETVESMHAIKYGKLQELSVQELIDCAGYNNNGCEGGDICTLLYWLEDSSVAIRTGVEYPLKWKTGSCSVKDDMDGVRILNFTCDDMETDERSLLETIAFHGPVAVAVNALQWQNYLGGVIRYHCDGDPVLLNHAVQIVGYDTTAEIPYYIARNSWGKDFGDNGYLYLAIGGNTCGLANEVVSLDVQ